MATWLPISYNGRSGMGGKVDNSNRLANLEFLHDRRNPCKIRPSRIRTRTYGSSVRGVHTVPNDSRHLRRSLRISIRTGASHVGLEQEAWREDPDRRLHRPDD